MKKLMIAAAIVCAAAFAQAAYCDWAAAGANGYSGGSMSAAQIYAFDTSALTLADLATAMENSNFSILSSGTVATDFEAGEAAGRIDGYGNGADVNMYLVAFNNASVASSTYYYVTEVEQETIGAAGQAKSLEFDLSDTATAANWTAIGAPEPTSGLLMLLGMGALALRRRRA